MRKRSNLPARRLSSRVPGARRGRSALPCAPTAWRSQVTGGSRAYGSRSPSSKLLRRSSSALGRSSSSARLSAARRAGSTLPRGSSSRARAVLSRSSSGPNRNSGRLRRLPTSATAATEGRGARGTTRAGGDRPFRDGRARGSLRGRDGAALRGRARAPPRPALGRRHARRGGSRPRRIRARALRGVGAFAGGRRDSDPPETRARRLREALEELGPTFAKLGQILSTRPDLLPPEAIAELAALQDRVTPMAEAEVVSVMEQELGVPWEDVFTSIEPEPLAAGTIGQVHRAVLEDGERVVVKVQRPTAQHDIFRDLSLLELFAEKTANRKGLRKIVDIPAVIEHLSGSLRRELDFKLEAQNLDRVQPTLTGFPRLGAPRVHENLTTSRLLVLEEIPGVPVRDMPSGDERHDVAKELLEFYYRQILVDGFFHADPHPGNMLWADGRVFFLDFGMVGELTPEMRGHLLLLLLAFWQEDVPFLTEVVLIMAGPEAEHADAAGLEGDLGELLRRYRHTSLGEIQLGPLLQEIAQSA